MALQHTIRLPFLCPLSPLKQSKFGFASSVAGIGPQYEQRWSVSSSRMESPLLCRRKRRSRLPVSRGVGKLGREAFSDSDDEDETPSGKIDDAYQMDPEERREWRRKIREVIGRKPAVEEVVDPEERRKKVEKLLADYPLIVDEEDPNWNDDSEGWGFNLGQFFDKITIKNNKKADDDNDDSDNEIVWKDDNYIRPIKDITTMEWEETVFKDISPLIILVHNRYKRPKENEKIREELERAVHIIWNCQLPSPRCVAVDAVVEVQLVSALQVSAFPEIIFTKAGKILYREKASRNADELSKIMAFFYYGAAKPSCLNSTADGHEAIPSVPTNSRVC